MTYGSTRAEALAKMEDALDNYVIRGVLAHSQFLRKRSYDATLFPVVSVSTSLGDFVAVFELKTVLPNKL